MSRRSRPPTVAVLWGILPALATAALAAERPAAEPTVTIPRLSGAPTLADFVGMAPASDAARQMTRVDGFLQREPHDGEAGSQRTEVYVGYDEKHLFAVFVCFDTAPAGIHAHLNRRENVEDEDLVQVYLDTFLDGRRAYNFAVNALGVQRDAIWTETLGADYSFDTVWDSRGTRTQDGYVVWMAIPFKSLRFPEATEQRWGLVLQRTLPRGSEEIFWPRVSRQVQGFLTQEGEIKGLGGISPGRNVQLIPYAVGQSYRHLDLRDPESPGYDEKRLDGTAGLDAKAVVKDRFVVDATFNPDFSQVESDDPQLTVNQRFAVYYPEKRPFFLENADFFNGPSFSGKGLGFYQPTLQYVFTRNIEDPEFGVRLTGRQGPYSMGGLLADDRGPGKSVPRTSPEFGKRAHFAIARVQRDLGPSVTLGAFFTDREYDGGFNRVGGMDGRFKMGAHWLASLGAATSTTRDPDSAYRAGPAYDAQVEYTDTHWDFGTEYHDAAPGFETDTGFFRRPDIRRVLSRVDYRFRPKSGDVRAWGPSVTAAQSYDHEGHRLDDFYMVSGNVDLPAQTSLTLGYGWLTETLRPQDFDALDMNRSYPEPFSYLALRSTPIRQVSFDLLLSPGVIINFDPPEGVAPRLADETLVNATLTVRPLTSLVVDNTYLLDRLLDREAHASTYTNHIIRSKWNYQLTRELSLRLILQYGAVLSNPSYSSLDRTKNLNGDVLLAYLAHPGTALYLGYNSNFENVDPALCQRLQGGFCDPEGPGLLRRSGPLQNDGHTFFVKLSYNFRY
ncbi:MAG: DUF5916 domain-containing protein [Vicinamibacteria bacterium]